jgi:hypothetical protein
MDKQLVYNRVFLREGETFELVPCVVKLGANENTRSLTIDWEKTYDIVMTGVPVGNDLKVGVFTVVKAVDPKTHHGKRTEEKKYDVFVERGTGKYFYYEQVEGTEKKPPEAISIFANSRT